MIAISSTYLGAYLLLIGIYSTALSSAQNIKIHNEISRIVQENSKISYEMGRAIFIDSIEKQVSKIGKKIEENSGIESASDPEELRDYIEQVIEEKKKGTLK
jgi:Asp-tRNA(Asn)/Glu-tRNA(Gln) amidotransferase B subunit